MGPRNLASDFNLFPPQVSNSPGSDRVWEWGLWGCLRASSLMVAREHQLGLRWAWRSFLQHSSGERDPRNITSGAGGGQEVALTPPPNKHPRETDTKRQHKYPSAPLPSPPSSTTEPSSPGIVRERPCVTLGLWRPRLPRPGSGPGQEGWGALPCGAPGLPAPHL